MSAEDRAVLERLVETVNGLLVYLKKREEVQRTRHSQLARAINTYGNSHDLRIRALEGTQDRLELQGRQLAQHAERLDHLEQQAPK